MAIRLMKEEIERLSERLKRLEDAIYAGGECPLDQARQIDAIHFLRTRWVPVKEYKRRNPWVD